MAEAAQPADGLGVRAEAARTKQSGTALLLPASAVVLTVALSFLLRPFVGVKLDSRIYIARAVADLMPATVGRDLMYAHDGQSPFSLFTPLARLLVGHFGPVEAAMIIAGAASVLWLAGAAALFTRIAPRNLALAMLAFATLLPVTYGGFFFIRFGEASALPRPFAEAGVMAALAAVIRGRRALAMALLFAAALFHPIMAACGFGVVLAVLALEDRRWLLVAAGGLVAVVIAAALGLPVASRLFTRVDPAWLELLRARNSYLFPGLWSAASWGHAAVQAGSAVVAASLIQGRARAVFLGAVGVAALGVLVTFLMGDLFPSLLILQLQPWRALWLVAVLGSAGMALAGVRLWPDRGAGRVVLGLLAIAWISNEAWFAIVPACAAVLLNEVDRRRPIKLSPVIVQAQWTAVGAFVLLWLMRAAAPVSRYVLSHPPASAFPDVVLQGFNLQGLVLCPIVAWMCLAEGPRARRAAALVLPPLAATMTVAAVAFWNRVPAEDFARPIPDPGLARMLAAEPGEIAWIDGATEPWFLAGRPSWASDIQGASIVFSRVQAMQWQARMRRMMALGLAGAHSLDRWGGPLDVAVITPSPQSLETLCAERDGPAWIVTPLADGAPAPAAPLTEVWRASGPRYVLDQNGGTLRWRREDRYALTRCERKPDRGGAAPAFVRAATESPHLRPRETFGNKIS